MNMARGVRVKSSTGIYHVMIQGVNRQRIFNQDSDCIMFLNMLKNYKRLDNTKIFAYCLMDNHVHLLLKEGEGGVSCFMHKLECRYAQWFNKRYGRTGYLFRDRFKSEPVEDDAYLLMVIKYIHFNPVKAGMCREPGEYRFSSFTSLKDADAADPTDFCEDVDFKELYGILDKERVVDSGKSFSAKDEICCVDTPEDRKLMVSEENLYKYASISEEEFKVKETGEKKALVSMLYEKGLSIRKIGQITSLSATYISRLLWAE